jgi:hypothetical protein
MSQLAEVGDQGLVNTLSGNAVPVASAVGSPPTWIPGLYWYNTTASAFQEWNGTAWVTSPAPGARYLALLTADPVLGGAVNITDPGFVELTTSGYARQLATFSNATAAVPAVSANTNLITFGPMSSSMLIPVQWVALVTESTTELVSPYGQFLASWNLSAPVQVNASQQIQIGIGQLVLQGQ